jgi:flavin reductase (DIM6/NTAB) family NADH-FMN oxidoreductase RutF
MAKKSFKGSAMLNPVPVVLINSINSQGMVNVFTAAWVGTACSKPPIISLAIKPERLSYENIKNSGLFTLNMPPKSLAYAVDFCGVKSGRDLDKIKAMNLELEDGEKIPVPSIVQCPVSLECKVIKIIELGSHHLFLAEILLCKVDEGLIDSKGKIDFKKADLICYSHGEYLSTSQKALGSFGYSVKKRK